MNKRMIIIEMGFRARIEWKKSKINDDDKTEWMTKSMNIHTNHNQPKTTNSIKTNDGQNEFRAGNQLFVYVLQAAEIKC